MPIKITDAKLNPRSVAVDGVFILSVVVENVPNTYDDFTRFTYDELALYSYDELVYKELD